MPIAAITSHPPQTPADDAPHLLLVDDDRRIRDLLSRFLRGEGYRVTTAASASDARAKLTGLHFDLLILDVMMPGESGFDLARFIRTQSSVPIVMLTARAEPDSRIEGLQLGADDYVAKPFEPRELALRIGNILKRAAPPPAEEVIEQIAFGPFVYHLARGELKQGEEIVHLTDREREMLRILANARGKARLDAQIEAPFLRISVAEGVHLRKLLAGIDMHGRKRHAAEESLAREPDHHIGIFSQRPQQSELLQPCKGLAENVNALRLQLVEMIHRRRGAEGARHGRCLVELRGGQPISRNVVCENVHAASLRLLGRKFYGEAKEYFSLCVPAGTLI